MGISISASAKTRIVVFAASSLTQSFSTLGKYYESKNPGVKIVFSFESSSTLATQITNGARADIFVSASPEDMAKVSSGHNYVSNRVVLAVPIQSTISKISDLNGDIKWVQCSHEVPCGRAADIALKSENVTANPISLESNSQSVVTKLTMGEVDAAIIYKSDVILNAKKIKAIEFSNKKGATTRYKIAKLHTGKEINNFFAYLKSSSSLKYLRKNGFDSK